MRRQQQIGRRKPPTGKRAGGIGSGLRVARPPLAGHPGGWRRWAARIAGRLVARRLRTGDAALIFGRRAVAPGLERLIERRERHWHLVERLLAPALRLSFHAPPAGRERGAARRRPEARTAGGEDRRESRPAGGRPHRRRETAPRLARVLARRGPSARREITGRGRREIGRPPAPTFAEMPTRPRHRLTARRRVEERAVAVAPRAFARSHPAPAAAERTSDPASHSPSRRPTRGDRRSGLPASLRAGTPAAPTRPSREQIDHLTEEVVRRIDRRMTTWRERTGRA